MGYYETDNLFRLFDIQGKKFVKKRDVVFHELIVGHHGFAADRLPVGTAITGKTSLRNKELLKFATDSVAGTNQQYSQEVGDTDHMLPLGIPLQNLNPLGTLKLMTGYGRGGVDMDTRPDSSTRWPRDLFTNVSRLLGIAYAIRTLGWVVEQVTKRIFFPPGILS